MRSRSRTPTTCLSSVPVPCERGCGALGPPSHLTRLTRSEIATGAPLRDRDPETAGACIPELCGPPPGAAEESLATAEVNSLEGLVGWRLRGQDSINVGGRGQQWGHPSLSSLMIEGAGGSSGGNERDGNNAKLHMALPRGQGFFAPRGPQVRGPPHIPTIRSGVMMELPLGNTRMASKERLAHVSFPQGGRRHPVENWPRSLPLSSSTPSLPSRPIAHCFMPPRPPSFSPFLAMPIAFTPLPIFGPPLPYFANFPSWGMPAYASSNGENN
ncbi:unnamed protein product [Nyctereutes procyonoides]|uniref:(raccoon dog) hypothetical protein n=1 Tax=Nyctereutes procyonoides TaxID=34880 RepID=A0A811YHN0_NYCPR|nr:unnamed protein product [Nyctereutes procyonoides]